MDVFVSSPGQFTNSNRSRKRNITQPVGHDIATTLQYSTSMAAGGSARLSPDRGSGHYSGVSYVSTDHCFPQMCVESNICSFLNTCFIERYDISSWFKYSMSEAVGL